MVHVKTLLDTRRLKVDGTYPIIYKITQYNKVYTLASGISIPAGFWLQNALEIGSYIDSFLIGRLMLVSSSNSSNMGWKRNKPNGF